MKNPSMDDIYDFVETFTEVIEGEVGLTPEQRKEVHCTMCSAVTVAINRLIDNDDLNELSNHEKQFFSSGKFSINGLTGSGEGNPNI